MPRGRRRKEDPFVDDALNRLAAMDRAGQLEPSELSDELERLATYRKLSVRTIWDRWEEARARQEQSRGPSYQMMFFGPKSRRP